MWIIFQQNKWLNMPFGSDYNCKIKIQKYTNTGEMKIKRRFITKSQCKHHERERQTSWLISYLSTYTHYVFALMNFTLFLSLKNFSLAVISKNYRKFESVINKFLIIASHTLTLDLMWRMWKHRKKCQMFSKDIEFVFGSIFKIDFGSFPGKLPIHI